jgi:hypothetical protein
MSRSIRVGFLLLAAFALCASGAYANIPSPELSNIPDCLTLSPGPRVGGNPIGGFLCHVEGALGGVNGSFVEVEVSPDADILVAWCQGQAHPIQQDFTDANGDVLFEWQGGGCVDPDEFFGNSFIVQVRADGIVLDEPAISSPDVVDSAGRTATDDNYVLCEGGTTVVGLSDAVYHTRPIKLGLADKCTKFTPPFDDPVGLDDAVFVTPYIKASAFCVCS